MFFFDSLSEELGVQPVSYQRKHCLTTAVKAFSSPSLSLPLSPPLIFSSSFLHFPVLVFGSSQLSSVSNTKREAVLGAPGPRHTQYLVDWWKAIPWMLVIGLICVSICSIVWQLCLDYFFLVFLQTHSFHRRAIVHNKTRDVTVCRHWIKLRHLAKKQEILHKVWFAVSSHQRKYAYLSAFPWL